jgi:hypothetical protein
MGVFDGPTPWGHYAILACILLLGIGLRFVGIGESIWVDESISLLQAQPDLGTSIDLLQEDVHVPLYTVVLNFWTSVFGGSVVSARSLSIVFSVMAMIMLYVLCRDFFDARTGLYASSFMAASELFIYYGQEIRPYSLFVFLSIASFYCYLRYRENTLSLWWYTAVNILLCYTHLFAAFALASQAIHYAVQAWLEGDEDWRKHGWLGASYMATFAAFTPWLSTLLEQAQNQSLSWLPPVSLSLIISSYGSYVEWGGGVLISLVGAITAYRWVSDELVWDESLGVLAAWILIPFLSLVTVSLVLRPVFHQRYLLFTIPALYIVVAWLFRQLPVRLGDIVAVGLVALFVMTPVTADETQRDEWRAVASYLDSKRVAAEPVFVQPYYHQQPLSYYYTPQCFVPGEVFSCNKDSFNVQSITRHNCCEPDEVTDERLDYHLPPDDFWLITVRDAPIGTQILGYANRTRHVTKRASFEDQITVYHVNSGGESENN